MSVRTRNQVLGAALAALVMVAVGCGRESVMTPDLATPPGQPISLPAGERPWAENGLQSADLPSVTVLVSAAQGGVVQMGRYRLEFPAGALSKDTPITIEQADPVTMTVHLLPHGIQFQKPVRFSARVGDLLPADAHLAGVAWFNDATATWEVVAQQSAGADRTWAELQHFSDYDLWAD